eukprot:5713476-Prymnesium_polylepis.1
MRPTVQCVLVVIWSRISSPSSPIFSSLAGLEKVAKEPDIKQTAPVAVSCSVTIAEVLDLVNKAAGISVSADAPLMEAGIDSLSAVELRNGLQRLTIDGITLPTTIVFDHPTARQLLTTLHPAPPVPAALPVPGRVALSDAGLVSVRGISALLPSGISTSKLGWQA